MTTPASYVPPDKLATPPRVGGPSGLGRRATARLLGRLMSEPVELVEALEREHGHIFRIDVPFGLTPPFTFATTREAYKAVLSLDADVGRNGPVIDRVPALAKWSPRSDMSDAHLQSLLLAGRKMIGEHLRARPWTDVDKDIRARVRERVRTWPERADLTRHLVAMLHEVSTRTVIGDDLWEALGPSALSWIHTIVQAVDAQRAVVALTPAARLLPECRATRALGKRLLAIANDPESDRYAFVRTLRTVRIGDRPLPAADLAWMMFFAVWNATLYVGTYGAWSFFDWCSRPALLGPVRAAPDRIEQLAEGVIETMRLHPISWQLRALAEPVELEVDGTRYEVPAGHFLTVYSYGPNRDPAVYADPLQWRPDRYRRGEPAPLLFGAGPFACVAQRWVKLLIATVHDALLDEADVLLLGDVPPRRCRVHLLYPSTPVPAWVRLRTPAPRADAPTTLWLPQDDPDPTSRARTLARQARSYVYADAPRALGVPPWMTRIPLPEWRRPEALPGLGRLTDIARRLFTLRVVRKHTNRPTETSADPWDRFHRVFDGHDRTWVMQDEAWRTDEAFGYQRLGGMTPTYLERVDALPSTFRVTDADLHGVPAWPAGATIASMIAARRLWMVRHPQAQGITSKPGTVLCSPQTLYVVRDDGKLVPVAIQLFFDSDVVFTPKDDVDAQGARTNRWLVAKMFVTNVDAQIYTLFMHTALSHIVVESAWGALCRTVSDRHPVRAFLAPHTELVHVIGEFFRAYYGKPGGEMVHLHQAGMAGTWQLLSQLFETWSFEDLDMPARHAARGWDQPDEPPGFVYRDDSRAHWDLLSTYVTSVVHALYDRDDTLQRDPEIQAWARELADREHGAAIRGLPTAPDGCFATREQLARVLTALVFQTAVAHSHVDNAAYPYFSFAPNMPLTLRLEPPRDHAVRYTDAEVAAGLPGYDDLVLQHALPAGNHPFHPRDPGPPFYESRLAQYRDDFMAGVAQPARGKVLDALQTWREGLAALAQRQDARNATMWPAPYDLLHPDKMSNANWY